jgi:16S rRNA (cytosine1402-N4)-methyltransferase
MVKHRPVLLKETLTYLDIKKGEKYIDTTVGGGGHATAILKKGGRILGLDFDPEAIKVARGRLSQACPSRPSNESRDISASWYLARGNFADLKKIVRQKGFEQAAGILFDLGVSSSQLGDPERGLALKSDRPLDMRLDPNLKVTAADLVNGLSKKELNELFSRLVQEKRSGRLASAIVGARRIRPIRTCRELADLIAKSLPRRKRERIHPATRAFLALRIAVNDEFNNLKRALPEALEILKTGGRMVVISFHSGEDRIVKEFFRQHQSELKILTKKPIRPSVGEIKNNPRSRSAKLRAAEKIA